MVSALPDVPICYGCNYRSAPMDKALDVDLGVGVARPLRRVIASRELAMILMLHI